MLPYPCGKQQLTGIDRTPPPIFIYIEKCTNDIVLVHIASDHILSTPHSHIHVMIYLPNRLDMYLYT